MHTTLTRRYRALVVLGVLLGAVVGGALAQPDPIPEADLTAILTEINTRREAEANGPLALNPDATTLAEAILAVYQADPRARVDLGALLDETGIISSRTTAPTFTAPGDPNGFITELFRSRSRADVLDAQYTGIGLARIPWDGGLFLYTAVLIFPNQCGPEEAAADFALQVAQAEEFLGYLNAGRAERDLPPLSLAMDGGMYAAALWYSEDMKAFGYPTQRPGGVAHIGTDGSELTDRLDREGYAYTSARENILFQYELDAEQAYTSWFNSPGHFANMMADDVTEMALAYTCDPANGQFYYTQVLGTPFILEDTAARAEAILADFNAARAEAGLPALTPVPQATDYLVAVAARLAADSGDYPDDFWDIMDGYGFGNAFVISGQSKLDTAATSATFLGYYTGQIVSSDATLVASGVYFDAANTTYLHVFVIGG